MDEVLEAIYDLRMSSGDFVVCGSVPLFIHGLRREPQDLDIVARDLAWEKALTYGEASPAFCDDVASIEFMHCGKSIEILNGWFPAAMGWTVDHLIDTADLIKGLRFMTLKQTLTWKEYLRRDKDLDDIARIKEYFVANQG